MSLRLVSPQHTDRLPPLQRQEVEEARDLLDQLAERGPESQTVPRLAHIVGQLHGTASNLLDLIDQLTAEW